MSVLKENNSSGIEVIKSAFFFWRKSILYQIIYNVLFISLFLGGFLYLMDYYEITEGLFGIAENQEMSQIQRYVKMQEFMMKNPNFGSFSWAIIGLSCVLFPLNLGLFAILRKIETNQIRSISDLFTGYRGKNFFIFGSYFLFWLLSFNLAMTTLILAPIWWLITLFVAPLMFFKNIRIFEGIGLTIKVLKSNFVNVIAVLFIGLIIKYFGIFSFFGIPFFFGFSNVIIYALYSNYFTLEES